ncbi:1750_t:CDS:2 [Funneliformis geosporum]|uniref:1750_t:CDS:1 n=1 Tax=Funneliformis geosporum TaxID=1117311 RepID=A0A9W4SVG3_9GLOM|nr:1750_t:CDS:2 [Funneliformis geosporum]
MDLCIARNSKSPFFLYELAKNVISAEWKNIKLVVDFVKRKEFRIKYRNNNSLYLVCPEEFFQKYDTAYDNNNRFSKEKY